MSQLAAEGHDKGGQTIYWVSFLQLAGYLGQSLLDGSLKCTWPLLILLPTFPLQLFFNLTVLQSLQIILCKHCTVGCPFSSQPGETLK